MVTVRPGKTQELAEALQQAAAAKRPVRLGGAFSKDAMAGPLAPADTIVSTSAMSRVLQYEPADLTISVEAGMKWADLTALLATNRQMIPLDPPFFAEATVGGVAAANTGGSRRRLYGTVRDAVIGMQFATLEGQVVQSGGMVVKNVAGLDMAKLMIGSFGTLAAIGVVNFKLTPVPETSRTFLQRFTMLSDAIAARDGVLRSVLQPSAVDLLNPAASVRVGLSSHYSLLIQAAGIAEVLGRYQAELPRAEFIAGEPLWSRIREFTPEWIRENPDGYVVRVGTKLRDVGRAMEHATGPCVARAGTGVVWLYGDKPDLNGFPGVVEFAPSAARATVDLWPEPGASFAVMQKVKALFDPDGILNRGRLYGRI